MSPDDVPLTDIIDVFRAQPGNDLLADGQSLDTLVARIPDRATNRVITFSTTVGVFVISGARELPVRASREPGATGLRARAVLRSDTFNADAIVSAVINDFRDTVTVRMRK
jgi:hypothetical protein